MFEASRRAGNSGSERKYACKHDIRHTGNLMCVIDPVGGETAKRVGQAGT